MSLNHSLLALVVGLSIAGCGPSELQDDEAATDPGDAVATIAPSVELVDTCGRTKLIRTSTVRSGYGTWDSWGDLPAGASVINHCLYQKNPFNGYNYVKIKNLSGGPIGDGGWVLQRNVY